MTVACVADETVGADETGGGGGGGGTTATVWVGLLPPPPQAVKTPQSERARADVNKTVFCMMVL